MKKILLLLLSVFLLASCAITNRQDNNTGSTNTGTNQTGNTDSGTTNEEIIGEGLAIETGSKVQLYYTLRENDENGDILDTNIIEDAIISGKSSTGDTLQPLDAIIGTQGLIPGFEKALIGMKKGETKSFIVSAEEGYGTGTVIVTVPKNSIAPVFTFESPKETLEGTVEQTFPRNNLPEWLQEKLKSAKVGETIKHQNDFEAKILELDDTNVKLAIRNFMSPFLDKELKVGLESTQDGIPYKIIKIEGNMVTVEVRNPNSPFTEKDFKVGTIVKDKSINPESQKVPYIKILDIKNDSVTIEMTNNHPLANKQLFFFVQIADVLGTNAGVSNLPDDSK